MAEAPSSQLPQLLARATHHWGGSRALGAAVGSSRNTVGRWKTGESKPTKAQVLAIARALHPRDRPLAGALAAAVGESLVTLGLEGPAPAPSASHIANGVLCVAAEAADLSTKAMRPALVVAFRAARDAGLGIDDVLRGLEVATPGKTGKS